MEKNEGGQLVRALGLKESISMTIGTVVGVGLFTCGSSQIGYVGSGIIVITFLSLLIWFWPCLMYGEMSAALPCAGGTYNYAKRGLNRVWANLAGWHYIISVVGIGAGETLAFSNYFKILFGELGINIEGVDSRIIAIVLVLFFLILNFRGIADGIHFLLLGLCRGMVLIYDTAHSPGLFRRDRHGFPAAV